MRLKKFSFSEHLGGPQEWILDGLTLNAKNLLVGKNASGKSRTINVIAGLARYFLGQSIPIVFPCTYKAIFEDENTVYEYSFSYGEQIQSERLLINGTVYIDRFEGGIGEIWAAEINSGINIKFQTPPNELAAVARRDSIQHPFLEPLHEWASNLRHYRFGTSLGKDRFAVFHPSAPMVDERDQDAAVGILRNGLRDFPNIFEGNLIKDMAIVGYDISQVGFGFPISLSAGSVPQELVGVYVKEKDLPGVTDQVSMSQGMYRVLALLIHVNYFQLKQSASCLLVDDIGEGLDFDRSCKLIGLLREKAEESRLQIVLSTNDRFVMNEVPLEEWSVLQRKANHVFVRNDQNSHEIFEEFKFTGLSNFSFLELDVINEIRTEEKS